MNFDQAYEFYYRQKYKLLSHRILPRVIKKNFHALLNRQSTKVLNAALIGIKVRSNRNLLQRDVSCTVFDLELLV